MQLNASGHRCIQLVHRRMEAAAQRIKKPCRIIESSVNIQIGMFLTEIDENRLKQYDIHRSSVQQKIREFLQALFPWDRFTREITPLLLSFPAHYRT